MRIDRVSRRLDAVTQALTVSDDIWVQNYWTAVLKSLLREAGRLTVKN